MAEQDTVTVEGGPGGIKAKATGSQTIHALLAGVICLWTWYLVIYVQDAKSAEREKARVVAIEEQAKALKELAKAVEANNETQKGVIYVLTMPPREREKLNLIRPEVLYKMQGYRER